MTPNLRTLLNPLPGFVLLGLLSGCEVVSQALIFADLPPYGEPSKAGRNYLEPTVLTSNRDMIRIKYLSVSPRAKHEQVTQLMNDHCNGSYIETSRVELHGWTTVDAECK